MAKCALCLETSVQHSAASCYLQFLHGQLRSILLGTLHQNVQRVAVILPLGTQRLLSDGFLDALLQGVSCTDALQNNSQLVDIRVKVGNGGAPAVPLTFL